MESTIVFLLNGISYGLLLFMLSSGLTLIFSMMGVLNFAHASFYMLGAYFAHTITGQLGYWPALLIAPLGAGIIGALFERFCLRKVHKYGHVPELLVTFGLSYVVLELVQIIWGRSPLDYRIPEFFQGPLFTLTHDAAGMGLAWGRESLDICNKVAGASCNPFPAYRGFMMLVALFMLVSVWLLLTRTRVGLIIQAALTHPEMAESLGHNVPRVFMLVFGGGAALAGLAGVIGGNAFATEPAMAASVGSIIFVVVVVGGMGSLAGAFVASLIIGVVQTYAVAVDKSLLHGLNALGLDVAATSPLHSVLNVTVAQMAPILPYLFLVLILIFRPRGLMGTREE